MSTAIFSPYWYRIAGLRPRLRAHARIDRQYQRDQLWYVLEDRSSGRQYRFTPAAHDLLGAMDGEATVQQIWDRAVERRRQEAPTQEEVLRLLGMLHGLDLIQCEVAPDITELFGRFESQQKQATMQRWSSPLSMKVSLFDPDRLLARLLPLLERMFSSGGFAIWSLLVITGLFTGLQHWSDLSENVIDRVLSPGNLLLLSLIYPCVKLAHEFGHAAATKVWGGEVHDMGALFIAFLPMPYVDCSAASMFRHRRQRAIVGAAGMMVELALAAVAMLLWVNVEPGLLRAAAFNVILIAGISTVLVNGNPLLRFDAYYILADLIGIPNLGTRANRYIGYLCQRYLFAVEGLESPVTAPGERVWFLGYGVISYFYRTAITVSLVWFIAGKYFVVGVVLAIWAAIGQLGRPLWRIIAFVFASPQLAPQRLRAGTITGAAIAVPVLAVFGMSMPLTTIAEGVVWMPEGTELRTGADATVTRLNVRDGDFVRAGDVLLESEDPYLGSQIRLYAAQARKVRAQLSAAVGNRVEMELARQKLEHAEAELARARERVADLIVRAPRAGRVVIPRSEDLVGKHFRQGEVVGYVLGDAPPTLRVVVAQERADLVRVRTERIFVRAASEPSKILRASLQRAVPGATDTLPSAALGSRGGGSFAVKPDDANGTALLQPAFQFDLELPFDAGEARIGERMFVRFDHGSETLGQQWYRQLRQLFLGKFEV
jgi:putative peptide zinc metalloprotease protein